MDEHCIKLNLVTKGTLEDSTCKRYLEESVHSVRLPGEEAGEDGSHCGRDTEAQLGKMGKVLERDGGDG